MTRFNEFVKKAEQAVVFSSEEMEEAMLLIMEGGASEPEMAAFLTHLARRGETAPEIAGAARAMRRKAATITAPAGAIDCCGTGGDGLHTYNISTAVALVAAACGVPVAKHGNRAASSKSGTADVLEALGVNLTVPQDRLESALAATGFCFLMAPHHHQAMKHVVPVRRALGHRTIFNLLGPLANPAGTRRQLIGVFDRKWLEPMALALRDLGTQSAIIAHGADGMDEITLCAPTHIARLHEDGRVTTGLLTPEDFGLDAIAPAALTGGDAAHNAAALSALLDGKSDDPRHNIAPETASETAAAKTAQTAKRDAIGGRANAAPGPDIAAYRAITLANTAALLHLAGRAENLRAGVALAAAALDEGRARAVLENYKEHVA